MNRIERNADGKLVFFGKVMPPGPWHDEPDHVDFEHAGFACILHRGSAWCGYVAVPPGHPWHGKSYDDVRVNGEDGEETWPKVHGGLTYSEKCQGAICHVAKPGEPDDVWWLGFDCNHSMDVSLHDIARPDILGSSSFGEQYRDVDYVRWQTKKLAEQAKAVVP